MGRWDWDASWRDKGNPDEAPYTVRENLLLMFKNMWKWEKGIVISLLLYIPCDAVLPLVALVLSQNVVQAISDGTTPQGLGMIVVPLILAIVALSIAAESCYARMRWQIHTIRANYMNRIVEKIMSADYAHIASAKGQAMIQKAFSNVDNDRAAVLRLVDRSRTFGASLVGLLSYAAIVMTLNPLIVLYILAMSIVSYLASARLNKWEYRNRDNWAPLDKKLRYVESQTSDFKKAKDVRAYGLKGWFLDIFDRTLKARTKWYVKYESQSFIMTVSMLFLTLLRDGISYGYLIYKMVNGNMPLGDFILYFGVIGGFATLLVEVFEGWADFGQISLSFCSLREFLELPERKGSGEKMLLPKKTYGITFEDLRFTYPGSENEVVKGMNLKIAPGEKLAIVGLNGAGKTTLVKLLCGLYEPTAGRIRIDGTDAKSLGKEEHFSLFSAVFQDVYMLPMSLGANVASGPEGEVDAEKVNRIIELANLKRKVDKMPQGIRTMLMKSVYPDAVELSGGEAQKLALARAIYKDAPILVLDEPTAALDPIAENEMYQEYGRLTQGRTSIFISHRLSSTSFCDRIILIEDGQIAEEGSHGELMASDSKYRRLFEIQSKYYKAEAMERVGEAK